MTKTAELVLAVDLGGTKTALSLVNRSAEILHSSQEATCQSGPQDGIAQIIRMARALIRESSLDEKAIQCVGVGIPAVLEQDTDFVIWAPNLAGWRNVGLRSSLQAELGLPVFVEYDGHTAVLGEWWVGSGRGYQSLVDVIIGTGIGGGMILEGKLIRGRDRLAGAAGWFALTTEAENNAGRSQDLGFWEALAAGPGLASHTSTLAKNHPESSLYAPTQSNSLTARDIFEAARRDDALALQVVEQWAGWLGLGIANITSLVNPEIIILGGGLGSNCEFLLPRIRQTVERFAQPISAHGIELVTSQLGSRAGLLGAAYGAILRYEQGSEHSGGSGPESE
jgi:glucokinase